MNFIHNANFVISGIIILFLSLIIISHFFRDWFKLNPFYRNKILLEGFSDASGNTMDASGNAMNASGNAIDASGTTVSGTASDSAKVAVVPLDMTPPSSVASASATTTSAPPSATTTSAPPSATTTSATPSAPSSTTPSAIPSSSTSITPSAIPSSSTSITPSTTPSATPSASATTSSATPSSATSSAPSSATATPSDSAMDTEKATIMADLFEKVNSQMDIIRTIRLSDKYVPIDIDKTASEPFVILMNLKLLINNGIYKNEMDLRELYDKYIGNKAIQILTSDINSVNMDSRTPDIGSLETSFLTRCQSIVAGHQKIIDKILENKSKE